MAFEGLSDRLQEVFKKLRKKGKITEADVKQAMREVRMALLEADVNYKVVKSFVQTVTDRAVGQEVLQSVTPGQQVVKIVYDEMTQLMGGSETRLAIASKPPTVYMAVGLQGAGKTTTVAKLARNMVKQGHRPLLVACDVYRPAAIKQLQVLGDQVGVPVFSMGQGDPVDIARASLEYARKNNRDLVLIDTAGRLHVNEELMDELKQIKKVVEPDEILLVVDAMTGQDAVNVASSFDEALGIDGVVLTKLDGDARGGAALSIKAVTGKPIKFVGMGEKLDALEPFHPDRMASRILGMGDVLTLIEKAEANINAQKAMELEEKLRKNEFTLDDFMEQMEQVRNMGPLEQILGMIPGLGGAGQLKNLQIDEKQLDRIQAIISSMTVEERRNPDIINGSRRRRISAGSGTSIQDVNRLLKQFKQTKKMMRQLSGMAGKGKFKGRMPFFH